MENGYGHGSIQALSGVECIRRRPGMYIGNLGREGLHQLVWELVGNSVDEHLAGGASWLRVELQGPRIRVEDDGRGIPLAPFPGDTRTCLEVYLSEIHAGYDKRPHVHVAPSLHGVGLTVVNALSAELCVEITRYGRRYRQRYERGEVLGPVEDVGPARGSGTFIEILPDSTIFGAEAAVEPDHLAERLRELAALNPGLTTMLGQQAFCAPRGSADHIQHLAGSSERLHPHPIVCRGELEGVRVDVALLWTAAPEHRRSAWVSQSPCPEGVHIRGYQLGLRDALVGESSVDAAVLAELFEQGLVALVDVRMDSPVYGSPTRSWLNSDEAQRATRAIVGQQLGAALAEAPALRAALLDRIPVSESSSSS